MSQASRAADARIKRALREHKAILRRQRQAHRPDQPIAMADGWDPVLLGILRVHTEDSMPFMRVVNTALKCCRPVDRANRELVKRTLINRLTVLRQAGIIGYFRRRNLKLLIHDPPIIFKPFDHSTLPEPDLS